MQWPTNETSDMKGAKYHNINRVDATKIEYRVQKSDRIEIKRRIRQ